MARVRIRTFTDSDAYQEAVGSAQFEVLFTARGAFRAELVRVDLPRVSLQAGQETLPRAGRGAVSTERSAIYFLIGSGQAPGRHCGVELSPGELVFNAAGSSYQDQTSADCRWGDISFAPEALAAASHATSGGELALTDQPLVLRPSPASMTHLARLHGRVTDLARTKPGLLARPEVVRALAHDLLEAVVACMADHRQPPRCLSRRHRTALARFEEVLAADA